MGTTETPSTTLSLPTREETLNLCHDVAASIKQAVKTLDTAANYRVASRELSIVRTKLDEADMWLLRYMCRL